MINKVYPSKLSRSGRRSITWIPFVFEKIISMILGILMSHLTNSGYLRQEEVRSWNARYRRKVWLVPINREREARLLVLARVTRNIRDFSKCSVCWSVVRVGSRSRNFRTDYLKWFVRMWRLWTKESLSRVQSRGQRLWDQKWKCHEFKIHTADWNIPLLNLATLPPDCFNSPDWPSRPRVNAKWQKGQRRPRVSQIPMASTSYSWRISTKLSWLTQWAE
jgi:hypothetical protein